MTIGTKAGPQAALPDCIGLEEHAALERLEPLGLDVIRLYYAGRKKLLGSDSRVVVRQRLISEGGKVAVELVISLVKRTVNA